jgi:hypothetical protein
VNSFSGHWSELPGALHGTPFGRSYPDTSINGPRNPATWQGGVAGAHGAGLRWNSQPPPYS